MREKMKTDVFYWHGYSSIYLSGKWVKATPAFNLSLCEKFNLKPLLFDGESDSLYHEFDRAGNQHMEYLNDRGEYNDTPVDKIAEGISSMYPAMINSPVEGDFEQDVARETGV